MIFTTPGRSGCCAGSAREARARDRIAAVIDLGIIDLGMSKPSDLLQGTLDLLILRTLAAGPMHGWAVAARIEQVSRDVLQITQGALYPALHRLEQQGWLRAEWKKTETARDAKFYALTRAGRAQLDKELAQWERLSHAVGLVVRMAEE